MTITMFRPLKSAKYCLFPILSICLIIIGTKKISEQVSPDKASLLFKNSSWWSGLAAPKLSFRKLNMFENSIPVKDKFNDWWMEKKKLRDNVRNTCLKYGSSVDFPLAKSELLYDQKHKLSFCLNAKVGTSTMLKHFQKMIPRDELPTTGRDMVKAYLSLQTDGPSIRSVLETTISFSVVRHPFERLVSAYQNKMVEENLRMKKLFLRQYPGGSFPDFADYVLRLSKSNCRTYSECPMNNHWRPYLSRCAYCSTNYTVVAKLETLQEDLTYLGQMVGHTFHQIEANSSGGDKKGLRDRARAYFSQLQRDVAIKLFELFRVDFEMFGYDAKEYLDLSGSKTNSTFPSEEQTMSVGDYHLYS